MKFAAAAVTIFASMTKLALAEVSDAHIHVKCKGVDFHALTEAEKGFSSLALMMSYNQIHQIADDGDYMLADIQFDEAEAEAGMTSR